ncbi:MAG: hypothetical protein Q4G05_02640 [Clostridia bacterium]|nr:hypothetical protein [Clostridia bacterium]
MVLEKEQLNDLDVNQNLALAEKQNKFIESKLWKVINFGIDMGIRAALPDLIEDEIIGIKDNFIEGGLKNGVEECINDAINLGKSVKGIATGDFENIEQVQSVIRNGGVLEGVSEALDYAVEKASSSNLINDNVTYLLKRGKDIIIDNVSRNIENEFLSQIDDIEKIQKYSNNWKEYYNQKNFFGMEKEYKKIKDRLKNLIPLENTLKNVRVIENLHTLIKNNNQDFNLSNEAIELANKLI